MTGCVRATVRDSMRLNTAAVEVSRTQSFFFITAALFALGCSLLKPCIVPMLSSHAANYQVLSLRPMMRVDSDGGH